VSAAPWAGTGLPSGYAPEGCPASRPSWSELRGHSKPSAEGSPDAEDAEHVCAPVGVRLKCGRDHAEIICD